MVFEPYQERVVLEKAALDLRRQLLIERMRSMPDCGALVLLRRQLVAMGDYSTVLGERIRGFYHDHRLGD